jgi:uncharacterized membrane protein YraQ (UPF0718 family)
MLNLLKETLIYVVSTLVHNAPVLAFGIFVAAAINVYVDPEKLKHAIMKKTGVSITGSVAFGAFTPFCACGTMAVIVSMMTTALPWGPIMAFLTSSPLMSPDEFILISGIVSLKFAIALTAASVIIGISSGYITHFIEKNTKFLENQGRFASNKAASSCCATQSAEPCMCSESEYAVTCCSSESKSVKRQSFVAKYKFRELFKVFYKIGVKQVLVYFTAFAAIGFLINKFVPAEFIINYLGSGNIFAVPLLSLIGLPLYVNGSSAIPIINSLLSGGASQGALLAFMITGPGTSAGVLTGLFTIMKKRAIGLYIAYLIVFAIILGYLYDFLLMLGT